MLVSSFILSIVSALTCAGSCRGTAAYLASFFILIFFLEQVLLIILVFYVYDVSSEAEFLISIFALIVITTASLEKFILEKKYLYLMKETSKVSSQNELTLTEMKDLLDKYTLVKEENRNLKRKLKQ